MGLWVLLMLVFAILFTLFMVGLIFFVLRTVKTQTREYLIQEGLYESTLARWQEQYREGHFPLRRIAKSFKLIGGLMILFSLVMYTHIKLSMPELYSPTAQADHIVEGTISKRQFIFSTCVGRPSVCAYKVDITDAHRGHLLLSDQWLARETNSELGERVELWQSGSEYILASQHRFYIDAGISNTYLFMSITGFGFILLGAAISWGHRYVINL